MDDELSFEDASSDDDIPLGHPISLLGRMRELRKAATVSSPDDLDSCHTAAFFRQLLELRSEGHLTDVTVCAEGKEIPCHRVVLSARSDFFRAMFCGGHSESKKGKIEIGGVSAEALQLLVDFSYTSKLTITTDNSLALFEAANMLQFEPVEHKCKEFLSDHLGPEICLGTWVLADKVCCTHLSMKAKLYALRRFGEVCQTEEFLQLPVDYLKMYISDEKLCAKKEERLLDVIMLWARHDLEQRQGHLKELMESVCFSHVDQNYLKNKMETDKIFAGVSGIMELIKDQSKHVRSRHIHQEEIVALSDYDLDMYRLDLHGDCVETVEMPEDHHCNVGSAACVLDNDLIVTGGDNEPTDAWRYSTSQNSWTKLGSLRKGRVYHGMAALNGRVYAVGGVPKNKSKMPLRDVEVYHERTNSWRERAPLKRKVYNFGIAPCCEKLYVFGGVTRWGPSYSLQCFNPTQNMWTLVSDVPGLTKGTRACTVDSKIYLVGGQIDFVLCYDPQEDYYDKMAARIAPWEDCSATVCGSDIFIISPGDEEKSAWDAPKATVQCYNISSGIMIKGKDLPFSLCCPNTVTLAIC